MTSRHPFHLKPSTVVCLLAAMALAAYPFRQVFAAEPQRGGDGVQRPNVIVMMVDDMGYSDLGCYGGEIKTPNLDALAAEGVRFTNFHNTSRCCPSRACILTGLYPHQTGMGYFLSPPVGTAEEFPGYQGAMLRPNVTIAEILKPLGYATGHVGKWHIADHRHEERDPKLRGFDFAQGVYAGTRRGSYHGGAWNYWGKEFGPTRYCTDWFGDQMVTFIEQSAKARKPFFAYWAPNAPHFPLHAKKVDIKKYKGVYDAGPEAISEARVKRMRELGILDKDMPWSLPGGFSQGNERQKEAYSRHRRYGTHVWTEDGNKKSEYFEEPMEAYAAQVDSMDQNVGKVIAKLKQLGLYDNTLIVFCSDNGASPENTSSGFLWGQASNTPFREHKASSFEGGVGTPLIMHWPKRIAPAANGSINRTWGHLIDIMPTVLATAGGAYPKQDPKGRDLPASEGGRSLLSALDGKHVPLDKPIFIEHIGNCALITEDWKLVYDKSVRNREEAWSLYNMKTDRCELTNVAKEHPDVVKKMDAEWNAIAKRIGAVRGGKRRVMEEVRQRKPKEPAEKNSGGKK